MPNRNPKIFSKKLLSWYHANKRDLPFRGEKDPYKIWLSEIMLQQTTVATVIDYYQRFIKDFPSIKSVAAAHEDELLKLWQGLGYYSRIRNFKKACEHITSALNGKFPQTAIELKELSGIGDYTAAAIASIAFAEPVAVVDGNVMRVIARVFAFEGEIGTKNAKEFFARTAQCLLDEKSPGDFNQAMMELGATVCTPKNPRCLICPVKSDCKSIGRNPEKLPRKIQKSFIAVEYASLVLHSHDKVLLKSPHSQNLIHNMWELPSLYDQPLRNSLEEWKKLWPKLIDPKKLNKGKIVRHNITNKKIITHIFSFEMKDSQLTKLAGSGFKVVGLDELNTIALNTLSRKIMRAMKLTQ